MSSLACWTSKRLKTWMAKIPKLAIQVFSDFLDGQFWPSRFPIFAWMENWPSRFSVIWRSLLCWGSRLEIQGPLLFLGRRTHHRESIFHVLHILHFVGRHAARGNADSSTFGLAEAKCNLVFISVLFHAFSFSFAFLFFFLAFPRAKRWTNFAFSF